MTTEYQPKKWNQLIEAFRGFGGIVDNVIQRPGPLGLGLFPIQPEQPIKLHVPEHLLIPIERISLQDGNVVLNNDNGFPAGYADWFQGFQADFSWGAEAHQTIQNFEISLGSLPSTLREKLQSLGLSTRLDKLPQTVNPQHAFGRFIETRQIQFNNSMVLMPILELINHSPKGKTWQTVNNGITVDGCFKEEILVRYSISDPLRRLLGYGFNCQETTGFSVNMQLKHRDLKVIIKGGINYRPMKPPKVKRSHNSLIIYQPLLGSFMWPKMPRTLFKSSLKGINVDSDELFDHVQHLNRIAVIQVLKESELNSSPISNQLRTACINQLISLSYHVGSREFNQQAT